MLALVALGVVHRHRRDWIAVDLQRAARELGVRPQRLSRLVTAAATDFEAVVGKRTRRGRPPRCGDEEQELRAELALTRELLGVATAVLARAAPKRGQTRDLLVGAWQRLASHEGMTQRRFCEALALPERTLRWWLSRPAAAIASPKPAPVPDRPSKPPKPPRPVRRRRFDFDVTLPGLQVGGDTTDIEVCGVPLKLMAAQDIGGRDTNLFDAVLVEDHESAELVTRVLTEALTARPGAQAITDQGTPYLAEKTREALSKLEVEHAPQKEGDPCGKSTVERAFGTLKSIAAPLFELTNRISNGVPALQDSSLARAMAILVLTALLRAYQHGARAARLALSARADMGPEMSPSAIARLAEQAREQARALDRSRRLLLGHIHELYGFPGAANTFVNAFAKYPLSVLQQAERSLHTQAHRDDIRDKKSYFGALVRRAHEQHRLARARDEHHRRDEQRLEHEQRARRAQHEAWSKDPASWLRDALGMLALQWDARAGRLLFEGHGLGLGWLGPALRGLLRLHGPRATTDLVDGVLHAFRLAQLDRLGSHGVDAIVALVQRRLTAEAAHAPKNSFAAPAPSAILALPGQNQRPAPSARLPN